MLFRSDQVPDKKVLDRKREILELKEKNVQQLSAQAGQMKEQLGDLREQYKNKLCATDDSGSIQNQKAMLVQYAEEQGWEVYQIYSDDDYTGADRRRPQFKRLLKDAEQHKFDIILCKTQSRFTRELELVEKYIHGLFPIWGIRFVSIVDNADTDNKGNKSRHYFRNTRRILTLVYILFI